MGLKGIEPADNGAWSHPPKKKWIHCYMSVGKEPATNYYIVCVYADFQEGFARDIRVRVGCF